MAFVKADMKGILMVKKKGNRDNCLHLAKIDGRLKIVSIDGIKLKGLCHGNSGRTEMGENVAVREGI